MKSFNANMVTRSHEEIEEMCKDIRDSMESKSRQFEDLTYEQGIIATVKWLFFRTGDHPSQGEKRNLHAAIEKVQKEILERDREQARENGSE